MQVKKPAFCAGLVGNEAVVRLIVQTLGLEENVKRADALDKYRAEMEAYEAVGLRRKALSTGKLNSF